MNMKKFFGAAAFLLAMASVFVACQNINEQEARASAANVLENGNDNAGQGEFVIYNIRYGLSEAAVKSPFASSNAQPNKKPSLGSSFYIAFESSSSNPVVSADFTVGLHGGVVNAQFSKVINAPLGSNPVSASMYASQVGLRNVQLSPAGSDGRLYWFKIPAGVADEEGVWIVTAAASDSSGRKSNQLSVFVEIGELDPSILVIDMAKVLSATGNGILSRAAIRECYPDYDISKVKSVSIPEGATTIASNTFGMDWVSLKSVVLPSSLAQIEDAAFYGSPAIEAIVLPAGLVKIGVGAFKNCSSLKVISFGDKSGWKAYRVVDSVPGYKAVADAVDVSNPLENAALLDGSLSGYALLKNFDVK